MSTIVVKDSTSFTLFRDFLTEKKVGDFILTAKRDVPCSGGLQWWIRWYPVGSIEAHKEHVGVHLCVNKPVKVGFAILVPAYKVCGCTKIEAGTSEFSGPLVDNMFFLSHGYLRPLLRPRDPNGKLTITCNVDFDILSPVLSVPRNFQLFHHVPMDIEIVVGSERVLAHKSFLNMLSPVFEAMFAHNTAESNSGKIEITDFDFATVKAAIDICYGRELKEQSLGIVISILRFCDKYFITPVIDEFERLPFTCLTTENFCLIIHYAYECNRLALLTECGTFFKEQIDKVKALKEFGQLPPTLIVDLLKSGYDLKTDFDVLRHAHDNGCDSVMKHLEEALILSMPFDDFFPAVKYAWDCSREDVKQACAKYLNDNRDEVLESEAFHDLPPEILSQLLKASYLLKRGQ